MLLRSVRRPIALLAQAALLAGLGLLATAWVQRDKTVTVSVDGHAVRLRTFASTVAGALSALHLRPSAHDVVAPELASGLHPGEQIVFQHGRRLVLTLDGKQQTVWVTARTVAEAMDQLGVQGQDAFVSASRSRPIGLAGMALAVRLPQQLTVLVDGHVYEPVTTEPTVGAVLSGLGIRLRPADEVSVPLARYPVQGTVVQVTRVDGRQVEQSVPIGYPTVRRPISSLFTGQSQVVAAGVDGVMVRDFALTYRNHVLARRRLVRQFVATPPRTQVIDYGTSSPPPPPPPPVRTAAADSAAPGPPAPSSDGLNWGALADCESGGNPQSVSANGQYYGLYQFSLSTWDGVGGSGSPAGASAGEQTYRAQLLYQRSGRSAWPVCGQYL